MVDVTGTIPSEISAAITPAGTEPILVIQAGAIVTLLPSLLPVSTAADTAIGLKQTASEKAQANGYASLDSGGKVPIAQIPAAVIGAMSYAGTWNATTNSPAMPAASSENKGTYYVVSVAGSTSVSGITDWQVGDWVVSNGTTWDKLDNSEPVSSVAGKTGAVTLTKTDVGLGNLDNTSDANKPVSTATQTALDLKATKGAFEGVNTQTASYTLVLADAGKIVEMNVATANNLTVPQNSSQAFAVGTVIEVVQYGAGQVTFVPDTNVTLRSSDAKLKLTGRYSGATLYKRATNEWVIVGDLST